MSSHMMGRDQIAWMKWGDKTQNLKIPSTAQTAKPQLTAFSVSPQCFHICWSFFKDSLAPSYSSNYTGSITGQFSYVRNILSYIS